MADKIGRGKTKRVRPFAESADLGSTYVTLVDYAMPTLSYTAWVCLCFLVRKTLGWGKDSDHLSYSQLMTGTGIKSRNAVCLAMRELCGERPVTDGRRIKDWVSDETIPQYVQLVWRGDYSVANYYALNTDLQLCLQD